jgi:hypothetical protein
MTRRLIAALVLISALSVPHTSRAQICTGLDSRTLTAYAHEKLTISASAVPFTSSVYISGSQTPVMALFTASGDSISYLVDGSTPTALVGNVIPVSSGSNGVNGAVCGFPSIQKFLAIRVNTDATLFVQYFK